MLAPVYAMAIPTVCASVCLCVTRVLCIKTAKHFVEILLPPDSPIILFVTEDRCLIPTASPLMGAPNRRGVRKFGDLLLTNKSVCLGNSAKYGHSCYRSRIGNHTRGAELYRMVALLMTLSDPNPQFQGHPIVRRQISRKHDVMRVSQR